MDFSALDAAVDTALPAVLDELSDLVAIPSVAAKSNSPMHQGAEAIARLFEKRGFLARLSETNGGPPVVYAEDRSAGVDAPTVLLYNHYDVQPAEPLDLWTSDPWTLRREGDLLYGRGTSDDKGHIACRLLALDALKAVHGSLPVNVKALIEGEEEIASPHLESWMAQNAALLNADVTLWEFGGVDETGRPKLFCGLRGIAYFELSVQSIKEDAHSGVGGSIFPNAAWRLVWALATLKTSDERVQLPGHYEAIQPFTEADRAMLEGLPHADEAHSRTSTGLSEFLGGVTGAEWHRRQAFEPTCTICGLTSGWQGEGAKTIIPARASAKVDFRLVPDQTPEQVERSLRAHLDAHGFSDVEIKLLGGQRPARIPPDHPLVQLAAQTAEEVYGVKPAIWPLNPATGPIHPFVVGLNQPIAVIGCGYPDSNVHAPDENLRISDLVNGAKHTARFLARLAS
jgi:acetylornithine deacetylase/succinyl-diaminopimelate desuccinylase-like protein